MEALPRPALGQAILLFMTKRAAFNTLVYSAMVTLVHMQELYRRYTERERETLQLETKLARAQLEALKIQLQPHFLFNTLNTISALLHRDPEAADRVVTRLGDLLRLSLQHSGRQEVMLRQELEFLERYLEIQQTRFRDRLTVHFDADPEALDALVPTLVLQPLVENAVRHAIEPRSAPGRLDVRARRANGRLTLEVADDGPGNRHRVRPRCDRRRRHSPERIRHRTGQHARAAAAALWRGPPVLPRQCAGGGIGGDAGDPVSCRQPPHPDPDSPWLRSAL